MTDLPGDIGGSNPLKIWLNKIKTAIKRRTLLPGLGYKLHQHESGVALEILNPGGGSVPAEEVVAETFRLKDVRIVSGPDVVSLDVMRCRRYNPVTQIEATTDVYLLRPYLLRQRSSRTVGLMTINYTYDAEGQRRTATSPGSPFVAENQVIVPTYEVGDILYGMLLDHPTQLNITPTGTPTVVTVEYVDINADGRAWARLYQ